MLEGESHTALPLTWRRQEGVFSSSRLAFESPYLGQGRVKTRPRRSDLANMPPGNFVLHLDKGQDD